MQPAHHIRRLLNQSDRLAHGAFEREVLLSARALADELGDDDLVFATELRISTWAMLGRDDSLRLESFGRCLSLHRSDPLRFPTMLGELDLLWDYATIPRALASSHRVSAKTIWSSLDDMVDVYSAAGADLAPCFLARYEWALRSGDAATTERDRYLRAVAGRSWSCCRGCAHAVELRRHLIAGREDAAIAEYDSLIDAWDECPTEPEAATASVLLPLVRRGDAARAVQLSDGLGRASPDAGLTAIGARIGLCAAVSDLEEGMVLAIESTARLPRHERSTEQVVDLLVGVGGLLDALTRAGRGAASVPFAEHPSFSALVGPRVGPWTTAALGRAVWASARDLAAQLDSRDGGTAAVARVERDRATGHGPRSVVAVRAALGRGSGGSSTVSDDEPLPDPQACLAAAREHASAGRYEPAHRSVDEGLLCADRDDRAMLLGLRVRMLVDRGATGEAERELERRIECLIVDDLDDEAELDLQLGLLLYGSEAPDAADRFAEALTRSRELALGDPTLARLLLAYGASELRVGRLAEADRLLAEAAHRAVTAHPGQQLRPTALLLRARARGTAGDHDAALALLDRVLATQVDFGLCAAAHLHRSHALLALGRFDDGLAEADRALDAHTRLGDHDGVIDTCGLLAALLTESGELDGAVEARRSAARTAASVGRADVSALRYELAAALVLAGRGEEARPELEAVLEWMSARADGAGTAPPSAASPSTAEVLWLLGRACRDDDDDAAAYCAWSLALERLASSSAAQVDRHARRRVEIGLALGDLLADQGSGDSLDMLSDARLSAAALGEPVLAIDAGIRLARALATLGDRSALAELDDTARAAVESGLAEVVRPRLLEERARASDDLGDESAAIADALAAAEAFAERGDTSATARLRLFAGRMLALAGRPEAARRELELAAAQRGPDGRAAEHELLMLAELAAAAGPDAVPPLGEPSTTMTAPG